MKRRGILSAVMAVGIGFVYADTYNVLTGWNMFGTSDGISDMTVFNTPSGCVKVVYKYNNSTNGYSQYVPGSSSSSLTSLNPTDGFWLNGSKNCSVSTIPVAPPPPLTSTTSSGSSTTSGGITGFSKPTQAACTAGGGKWNSYQDNTGATQVECYANWNQAVAICNGYLPSLFQLKQILSDCGANFTPDPYTGGVGGTVSGLYQCVSKIVLLNSDDNYGYWTNTYSESNMAWQIALTSSNFWTESAASEARYSGHVRCTQ